MVVSSTRGVGLCPFPIRPARYGARAAIAAPATTVSKSPWLKPWRACVIPRIRTQACCASAPPVGRSSLCRQSATDRDPPAHCIAEYWSRPIVDVGLGLLTSRHFHAGRQNADINWRLGEKRRDSMVSMARISTLSAPHLSVMRVDSDDFWILDATRGVQLAGSVNLMCTLQSKLDAQAGRSEKQWLADPFRRTERGPCSTTARTTSSSTGTYARTRDSTLTSPWLWNAPKRVFMSTRRGLPCRASARDKDPPLTPDQRKREPLTFPYPRLGIPYPAT
jgi:hypothetical protein